jgi:putative membrane protein
MTVKWTATALATIALAVGASEIRAQTPAQPPAAQPGPTTPATPPAAPGQKGAATPPAQTQAQPPAKAATPADPSKAPSTQPQRQAASPDRNERQGARTFVRKAMQGDLAEIRMGKLAQARGTSARIKGFGRTLVTDHRSDYRKAARAGLSVAAIPALRPSAEQRQAYQRLAGLSGARFDRAFARHMVEDHRMDIREHQQAANRFSGRVGDYAKNSLPVLRKHLALARALASNGANVSSDQRSGSQASGQPAADGARLGGGNNDRGPSNTAQPSNSSGTGASGPDTSPQSGTAPAGQPNAAPSGGSPPNPSGQQ